MISKLIYGRMDANHTLSKYMHHVSVFRWYDSREGAYIF